MNTTAWRWFPAGLIGAMGIVFAVNFVMVYDALHTFPGAAGSDGFDLSNNYDRVLAASQAQAALGWQIAVDVTSAHTTVLRLTDRNGAALAAPTIDATAERPLGPADTTALKFRPIGDGKYQADTTLFSGQWDILLSVHADGSRFSTTQRVFVK